MVIATPTCQWCGNQVHCTRLELYVLGSLQSLHEPELPFDHPGRNMVLARLAR